MEFERDSGRIMTHEEEVEHVDAGENEFTAGDGRLPVPEDVCGVFTGVCAAAACSAAGVGLNSRGDGAGASSSESARSTCSAEPSWVVHVRSGKKKSSAGFRSPASGPVAVHVWRRIFSMCVSM